MSTPIVVEFVGLPCVGKTRLSREVARRVRERGMTVAEPTWRHSTARTPRRLAAKATYASRRLATNPHHTMGMLVRVLESRQPSIQDLVSVGFNLVYVTGVLGSSRTSRTDVILLDQGWYQALWSVGLASTDDPVRAIAGMSIADRVKPDLVVHVTGSPEVIEDRMNERDDGSTRWFDSAGMSERGADCLEAVRQRLNDDVSGPPEVMTVENDTLPALRLNAVIIRRRIDTMSGIDTCCEHERPTSSFE